MIECQITEDNNTQDKIMVFRINLEKMLTNQSVMNILRDEIYNRVISEISADYLKKNKETIIAKIDTQELANLIKNKISIDIIQSFKKEEKQQKEERPYCVLGCPDTLENLKRKRLKGNKRGKPVDPELCYERIRYKCRLINK